MNSELKLYRWDTDIGEMLALAADVPSAREQVLNAVPEIEKNAAWPDVQQAIAGEPDIVTAPMAVIAWM